MKKLLKSKICGSVNSAHRALFTGKVKYINSKKKKKKKTKQTQNVRLGSPKRTPNVHNFPLKLHNFVHLMYSQN